MIGDPDFRVIPHSDCNGFQSDRYRMPVDQAGSADRVNLDTVVRSINGIESLAVGLHIQRPKLLAFNSYKIVARQSGRQPTGKNYQQEKTSHRSHVCF